MIGDHDRYGDWVAAYALGALDADDRRSFEQHLATCSRCATELTALAPLPGLLARVEPGDVEEAPDAGRSRALEVAAWSELAALHRRTRRWRWATVTTTAAAAVLAGVLVVPAGNGGPDRVAATVRASQADSSTILTTAKSWGTEIVIELRGLPVRDRYQLWIVDRAGGWSSAATWSATASGNVRLTGATSTGTKQVERILVTSDDRADVLVEAFAS